MPLATLAAKERQTKEAPHQTVLPIYIYTHTHTHILTHTYIYIYIERERETYI